MKDFKETTSYQIVNHLYDERKDFIILGLCGKVGSGVTETANILEKTFDELYLPVPRFGEGDLYSSREYYILYTYAKANNWTSFYKIRASALITRRVLSKEADDLSRTLEKLANNKTGSIKAHCFDNTCKEFFESKMIIDLKDYCSKLRQNKSSIRRYWCFLEKNSPINILSNEATKPLKKGELPPNKVQCTISSDLELEVEYNAATHVCAIKNVDLSRLVDAYAKSRIKKTGFQNPFWYLILKQYLYEFLPEESSKLWEAVRNKSKRLPFTALQYIGNNLRMFKAPYYTGSTSFQKDGYVCIAEDINLTIKVLRAYQLQCYEIDGTRRYVGRVSNESKRTVIVIDSIKNPYESMYLKTRYSNYYLIGIYTEDEERRKRLRNQEHLVDDDIDVIDVIEQNSEFKREIKKYESLFAEGRGKYNGPYIIKELYNQFKENKLLKEISFVSPFIIQNVSSCLDVADILINNKTDTKSFINLKMVLLRYVCLIMNPGIVLPTNVERCMQIANAAKLNSGCISRQVGAVLTDDEYHLLSVGWNQQPEGQLPCLYQDLCEVHHHWSPCSYSDYENNDNDDFQKGIKEQVEKFFDTDKSPLKEKGKLPYYCFKDYFNKIKKERNQVHTRALHAEETAFLNLGANNTRIRNGVLFTTSSPCELCAKKAMYMGVSKIYYVEPYAGVSKKHVLSIGKADKRPELILFTGAIGTAYTKLYTPLLPQKDEMEMWLGAKMDTDLLEMLEEHMEKDMKIDLETTDKSKTALIYDEHNTKQDRCVKRNVCRRSLKCKK